MDIVAPITQGYLFSEMYNAVGGENSMVAGLPISAWENAEQTGGAKLHEEQSSLAVPAGLVVMEDTPRHKIKYSKHATTKCEVIPDDLFDKLVDMVKVGKQYSRKNRKYHGRISKRNLAKIMKEKKQTKQ